MSKKSKTFSFFLLLNYWIPVVVWCVVIFTFSSQPTQSVSELHWQDFVIKKSAHVFEYAVLMLLLFRAFKGIGVKIKNSLWYSLFIAICYGISDEFHQSFTPGREPTIRDVLFDSFGAVATFYFISTVLPKCPERIKMLARSMNVL